MLVMSSKRFERTGSCLFVDICIRLGSIIIHFVRNILTRNIISIYVEWGLVILVSYKACRIEEASVLGTV